LLFSLECPKCKAPFQIRSADLAQDPSTIKCGICGNTPAPDIMTAYQNVGKTIVELQGCCSHGEKGDWLLKKINP